MGFWTLLNEGYDPIREIEMFQPTLLKTHTELRHEYQQKLGFYSGFHDSRSFTGFGDSTSNWCSLAHLVWAMRLQHSSTNRGIAIPPSLASLKRPRQTGDRKCGGGGDWSIHDFRCLELEYLPTSIIYLSQM